MATTVYRIQCPDCSSVHIIDGDSRYELTNKLNKHLAREHKVYAYYHHTLVFVNANAYAALIDGMEGN